MSKATASAEPASPASAPRVSQEGGTRPRRREAKTGLELDEHGLPLAGPLRAQRLAERGIPDPALIDPDAAPDATPETNHG